MLICSFGQPSGTATGKAPGWEGRDHCQFCAAELEQGCAAFAAAVRAGTLDRWGFTQAEAKRRPIKQLALEWSA